MSTRSSSFSTVGYYSQKYLTRKIKTCSWDDLMAGMIYPNYNEIHWAVHFNQCRKLLGKDCSSDDDTDSMTSLGLQCFRECSTMTFGHLAQITACLGRFKVTNTDLWDFIMDVGVSEITSSTNPIELYMFIKGIEESPSHQYLNQLHTIEEKFNSSDISTFRPNLLVSWAWIYLELNQSSTFFNHLLRTLQSNMKTYSGAELCLVLKVMSKMEILDLTWLNQLEILLCSSTHPSSVYGAMARHFTILQYFPTIVHRYMENESISLTPTDQFLWNNLVEQYKN